MHVSVIWWKMKAALAGPDDQGFWYLTNDGRNQPLVVKWEDHVYAAQLFGLETADVEEARLFLFENINREITVPLHLEF